LFFVSGSVGLVYEVAWQHVFTTVFGNTTYAVSVIIAVFMAGMALGSRTFGKVADRTGRQLLTFAALQGGIGLLALVVPVVLGAAESVYGPVFRAFEHGAPLLAAQLAVCVVVLLPPTFLMGGTLPVLSRLLAARRGHVGASVGLLYGLNTIGAAAGAFVTGFVLIKAFGTRYTIWMAAVASLSVAAASLALHSASGWRAAPPPQEAPTERDRLLSRGRAALLLVAVGVSGFVSFSYEVLWTRLLTFRLNTTVYAFSTMLTTFLLGLGLGGAAVGLLARKRARAGYWRLYGYLESAVGLCGLASLWMFFMPRLPYNTFLGRTMTELAFSAAIMIVPTTLLGAAFPIACHLLAAQVEQTGRAVGRVYLVNTVGAVAGALLTGFVLVRLAGTPRTLVMASLLIVAGGSAILAASPAPVGAPALARRGRWPRFVPIAVLWALVAAFLIAGPEDFARDYFLQNQTYYHVYDGRVELLGYAEGVEGVVVVCRSDSGYKSIASGATTVAGTDFTVRNTQKLQGHVPMLLHPDPRNVCQVGFGSGETARIFLDYGPDRLDVVEISGAMLRMADEHFADINGGVVHDPGLNVVVMDGSIYLKHTGRRYDVIANDSIWPHLSGNHALYTLEYFRSGRERLKPGGIMTSWFPLDLPLADLKILLKTFCDVFPHVYVWTALSHTNKHALLVGMEEPLSVDAERLLERFDRFARQDLEVVHLDDPAAFLTAHLAAFEGTVPELAGMEPNTEDLPRLQFLDSRPGVMTAQRRRHLAPQAFRLLAAHRDRVERHLTNLDGPMGRQLLGRLRPLARANQHVLEAAIHRWDDSARRAAELEAARQIAPAHPALLAGADAGGLPEELASYEVAELAPLARMLRRRGDYASALDVLREWQRREPESLRAATALGMLHLEAGNLDRAIEALRRVTGANPALVDAQLALGVAYLRTGRPRAALPHLRQAQALAPPSSAIQANLGTAYGMLGELNRALEHLERSLELEPRRVSARSNMADVLLRLGRAAEAVEHLQKVVELRPDSPAAYRHLARAHQATGDTDAARRCTERAEQLESMSPTAH
jgi:spermidine synthase